MGRLRKSPNGPGIILVYPCIEHVTKVDMRTVSFDVAPQEVKKNFLIWCILYRRVFRSLSGSCDPLFS